MYNRCFISMHRLLPGANDTRAAEALAAMLTPPGPAAAELHGAQLEDATARDEEVARIAEDIMRKHSSWGSWRCPHCAAYNPRAPLIGTLCRSRKCRRPFDVRAIAEERARAARTRMQQRRELLAERSRGTEIIICFVRVRADFQGE